MVLGMGKGVLFGIECVLSLGIDTIPYGTFRKV